MNYKDSLDKLFSINLFGGMKLGLQNMAILNENLGLPTSQFKVIHVAGSNGKGSVSTKIAKSLEFSGLKVGLFTSPHISCFRERIRINGEMIPESEVVDGLNKLFDLSKILNIPCTFFELTTMLAFIYFAKEKVDIAVLETGIGGRLDATNIVIPIMSVITSISLDHTEILGDTIEKIAFEKAGIIKPNVPVVIGPNVPFEVINPVAIKNNSPLIQVTTHQVNFDEENNAIAKCVLEKLNTPKEFIIKSLSFKPACRMETVNFSGKTFILDVAHNPDGLTHLFAALREKYQDQLFRLIFGLSQSKDIEACVAILKQQGTYFHIVSARNGRGMPVSELAKKFSDVQNVFTYATVSDAIQDAIKQNEIIIICGTFFIMSDARAALSIIEPRDTLDMNERSFFKKPS